MKGYEKHVYGYYQHIYDLTDWNIATYGHTIDPNLYKGNELQHLYESARRQRNNTYQKNKECMNCKHYYICDGYEKNHGHLDVFPEEGEKIKKATEYL
jgi:radical SAM protein with 4Fe4S-binding SPASM domain